MRPFTIPATIAAAITAALFTAPAATAAQSPTPRQCASAWQDSTSDTADACRAAGWKVRPRLTVNPHGVVKHSTLPSCDVEDASSGRVPCSWNLRPTDGNGEGYSFYVTGRANVDEGQRFHYVWPASPVTARWRWVTRAQGDALAEGAAPNATTRAWEQCIIREGNTTRVRCADGYTETS